MAKTYTVEQLKLYLNNSIVREHVNNNWNMKPDDVLNVVETYITKQRDYFRDYYNNRKSDINVTSNINEHNRNWYQTNKIRVTALQRCKYSNDPEYKQWCEQYQALYAQNRVM